MPLEDFLEEENLEFADEDIGEFLISVITGGLYIEPHLILREYIQNSHDAITAWQDSTEVGRIDIKIDPPNIHIFDNGPGMSRDELVASMSKVGISSKPFGAASGFMGIGKLAGLSMAERVQIDSSKYGTPEKNRVAFNAGEMLQAIDERRLQGESNPITVTL
jgi:HSP90 family molecular chaperone